MYSLILMTAMATSGDTASFGWRQAGCHGCYGSCYGGWGGCCGGSCHGAGWYGSACWGSCYGSSYQLSCHGYGMGHGAGFYGVPYTGHSCHGSACYGGCHGSCLGSACYGWSMGGGAIAPPAGPYFGAAPAPAVPTYANVIVELPAGAKLYVDGQLVNGAAATRRFHTPDLPAGQAFYYEMKAETEVDGKPVSQTTKVVVHAGETVTARFDKLTAAAPAGGPGGTSVATK